MAGRWQVPRGSPTGKVAASVPTGANQKHAHGQTQPTDVSTPKGQTRDSSTRGRRRDLRGPGNPNWRGGIRTSYHGYAMLFVGHEHPLADSKGYAYIHLLVWVSAGRPKPGPGEELHHVDRCTGYNRLNNIEVITTAEHARHHAKEKPRVRGRFVRVGVEA